MTVAKVGKIDIVGQTLARVPVDVQVLQVLLRIEGLLQTLVVQGRRPDVPQTPAYQAGTSRIGGSASEDQGR
jgi:hypothetical protein